MLYKRYKQAQLFIATPEPLVRIVGSALHHHIILDEAGAQQGLRPQWPFDMLYFYLSVTETIADYIGYPFRIALPKRPQALANAIPDVESPLWSHYDFVRLGLASQYITRVCSDSAEGGDLFDVSFALQIAAGALDQVFFDSLRARIDSLEKHGLDDTLDDWLSGFDSGE